MEGKLKPLSMKTIGQNRPEHTAMIDLLREYYPVYWFRISRSLSQEFSSANDCTKKPLTLYQSVKPDDQRIIHVGTGRQMTQIRPHGW